jgi:hypothetical protein
MQALILKTVFQTEVIHFCNEVIFFFFLETANNMVPRITSREPNHAKESLSFPVKLPKGLNVFYTGCSFYERRTRVDESIALPVKGRPVT